MGTPNTANVAVGKPRATGGVYAGATSATLPTNSTASVHSSLTAMGYVGDAGLVQTKGGTVTTIRAWGGDPVKVIRTTDDLTYAWTFLELTTEVLLEVFGQSAVEWTDNFGGQVTVTFVDGQATGFPVNLIALPDSSANKAYWYLTKFAS
jgi:hypothetical protein